MNTNKLPGDRRTTVDRVGDETKGLPLTNREKYVLCLRLCGLTAKQVSEELEISKRTVDFHGLNGFRKLGVRNMMQCAAAAPELLDRDAVERSFSQQPGNKILGGKILGKQDLG